MGKILIAYATWSGTVREVSEKIGDVLKAGSTLVEVKAAKNVKAIDAYQAVVLGTSIHLGQTGGAFRRFLSRFNKELSTMPTAFFVVCANMMEDTEENRSETLAWLKKATDKYPEISPIATGLFGGAVITKTKEFNNQNYFLRKIIQAMQLKWQEDYGKSDFRDWEKIESWSMELTKKID